MKLSTIFWMTFLSLQWYVCTVELICHSDQVFLMLLTDQLLKSSNKSASAYLTIYTSVNIIVCFNFLKKNMTSIPWEYLCIVFVTSAALLLYLPYVSSNIHLLSQTCYFSAPILWTFLVISLTSFVLWTLLLMVYVPMISFNSWWNVRAGDWKEPWSMYRMICYRWCYI